MQETVQSPRGGCLACPAPCGSASPCSSWSRAFPSSSGPSCRSARPRSPWADPEEDRSQQLADRRPQGQGAGADDRHLHQTGRIDTLQSDITRLSARQQKLQTSLDAKRAELAVVQRKLRQERARLTRLRARLLVVRRALAQRLIELYKADGRTRHRRARVRRLRRPADPHRVHGAHLPPGREDHGHRLRRQGRRDRHRQAPRQAREAPGQGRQGDRVPARRGLDRPRRPRRPPRPRRRPPASTRSALLASSRDRRHELEDDVANLHRSRRRSRPSWPALAARHRGPIKPGSAA